MARILTDFDLCFQRFETASKCRRAVRISFKVFLLPDDGFASHAARCTNSLRCGVAHLGSAALYRMRLRQPFDRYHSLLMVMSVEQPRARHRMQVPAPTSAK